MMCGKTHKTSLENVNPRHGLVSAIFVNGYVLRIMQFNKLPA